MKPSLKKITALFIVFSLVLITAGCREKTPPAAYQQAQKIVLKYYKMNDSIDVMKPYFDAFTGKPGNQLIEVQYTMFDDLQKYEDRIVNEMAEGEGPDIFSMPNYWISKHQKKIAPLPAAMMTPETFKSKFVNVAEKDLLRLDSANTVAIYGLPLEVDTLALYYNKAQFEDKIPERGKPSVTWAGLAQDIAKISKTDNSFERFELAGVALGRGDNITYPIEILYALMVQLNTKFYNETYTESTLGSQQGMTQDNKPWFPGVEALKLFTSFAQPASSTYTWNQYLADPLSADKEIAAFAKGKVSMIFGFSGTYQKILAKIKDLKGKNQIAIDPNVVQITYLPQISDPAQTTNKRSTVAFYYAETVSRTSKRSKEAWQLLQFMTEKGSLQTYNTKTHKPTSLRELIPEQKSNQIYGIFAEQAGFADDVLVFDYPVYEQALKDAIAAVLESVTPEMALKKAEQKITSVLPDKGLPKPGPYAASNPTSKTTKK